MRANRACWTLTLISALLLPACGGGGGSSSGSSGGSTPTITAADMAHALSALNAMRATEAPGAAAFVQDAGLDAYATMANDQFAIDELPHTYFNSTPIGPSCPAPIAPMAVGATAAENEGRTGPGPLTTIERIDAILAFYLSERDAFPMGDPRRGHYETIINPGFNSVGIAMKYRADGEFFISWEFCD